MPALVASLALAGWLEALAADVVAHSQESLIVITRACSCHLHAHAFLRSPGSVAGDATMLASKITVKALNKLPDERYFVRR